MARLNKACPGDCAKCQLAISGEVDMIPCVLDKIFQNQKILVARLNDVSEQLELLNQFSQTEKDEPTLASLEVVESKVKETEIDAED